MESSCGTLFSVGTNNITIAFEMTYPQNKFLQIKVIEV